MLAGDMLSAFSEKDLRTARNVILHCESIGLSIAQFKNFAEEKGRGKTRPAVEFPVCPECGAALVLRSLVQCNKANQHLYKSHFYCSSEGPCLYEEYSKLTVEAQIALLEKKE